MVSGPHFYLLLVYHPSATEGCQAAMQAEGVGGGKPRALAVGSYEAPETWTESPGACGSRPWRGPREAPSEPPPLKSGWRSAAYIKPVALHRRTFSIPRGIPYTPLGRRRALTSVVRGS